MGWAGATAAGRSWIILGPPPAPTSLNPRQERADLRRHGAGAPVLVKHDGDDIPGIQVDVEVGVDAVKPAAVTDDLSGCTCRNAKPVAVVRSQVVRPHGLHRVF